MDKPNIALLIFEKWIAALKNKDRSKNAIAANFDELFSDLKSAGATFEEAYKLLPLAIKAHQPSSQAKKNTWNKIKTHVKTSEADFYTEWADSIKSHGTDAFFANYPLKIKDDEDNEPKIYGSMSAKEYKLQRKHADSFQLVDTAELVKRMKERKTLDVDLTNVLGEKDDETK